MATRARATTCAMAPVCVRATNASVCKTVQDTVSAATGELSAATQSIVQFIVHFTARVGVKRCGAVSRATNRSTPKPCAVRSHRRRCRSVWTQRHGSSLVSVRRARVRCCSAACSLSLSFCGGDVSGGVVVRNQRSRTGRRNVRFTTNASVCRQRQPTTRMCRRLPPPRRRRRSLCRRRRPHRCHRRIQQRILHRRCCIQPCTHHRH